METQQKAAGCRVRGQAGPAQSPLPSPRQPPRSTKAESLCRNPGEQSPPQGPPSSCAASGASRAEPGPFGGPRAGEGVAEMRQFELPTSEPVAPQSSAPPGDRRRAGCQQLRGRSSKKRGCPPMPPPSSSPESDGVATAAWGGEAKGCGCPFALLLVYKPLSAAGPPGPAVQALGPFPEVTCSCTSAPTPWSPPSLFPGSLELRKHLAAFPKKARAFSAFALAPS